MEASPLKRLPAELRLYIYELALTETRPVNVVYASLMNEKGERVSISTSEPECALAETCCQIRMECLPVFFKQNTFLIRLDSSMLDKSVLDPNTIGTFSRPGKMFKPLAWFGQGVTSTNLLRLRVLIDIGEFDLRRYPDLKKLVYVIRFTQNVAKPYNQRFSGQCLIQFTMVDHWTTRGDGERNKTTCTIDCWNLSGSFQAISEVFAKRMSEIGVNIRLMRGWSNIFKWLSQRDWAK